MNGWLNTFEPTQRPERGAIDWDNPLTNGLVFGIVPPSLNDLVSGVAPAITGSIPPISTIGESAFDFTGGTAWGVYTGAVPYFPPPFSVVVEAYHTSAGATTYCGFGGSGSGATGKGWRVNDSGLTFGGVANYSLALNLQTALKRNFIGITVNAQGGTATGYNLGVQTGTVAVGTALSTAARLSVANDNEGGGTDKLSARMGVIYVWNRAISADEYAQLYLNPYSFFTQAPLTRANSFPSGVRNRILLTRAA